ncbi:hypothetical protein ADIMK_1823 [Marinobacterium lacunae]|uniref:Uncharacterized protein n=1 Tax=Marinobacterium lacunae TaxID=1232683 RepID=A0A081FZY3_9GAMM|nr:hypothetical protein ADIMK_1823 [Marinobacterium lacunae]
MLTKCIDTFICYFFDSGCNTLYVSNSMINTLNFAINFH